MMDSSSAYEKYADRFLQSRDRSSIGAKVVRRWADQPDTSTQVLELASGAGYPITRELEGAGFSVWQLIAHRHCLSSFNPGFQRLSIGVNGFQSRRSLTRISVVL